MKSMVSKIIVDLLLFQVFLWIALLVFDTIQQDIMPVWVLVLLIINALLYIVAAYLIIRGDTIFEYGVAGFLAINIIMTIFDQLGALDIVILVLNSGTLILLIWLIIKEHSSVKQDGE